jgi:hypothetical protein
MQVLVKDSLIATRARGPMGNHVRFTMPFQGTTRARIAPETDGCGTTRFSIRRLRLGRASRRSVGDASVRAVTKIRIYGPGAESLRSDHEQSRLDHATFTPSSTVQVPTQGRIRQ